MRKQQPGRRKAISAGMGALAAAMAIRADAAGMSDAEKANLGAVDNFCAAWAGHDVGKIMSFFAPECSYRVTEAQEPNKGRDAVEKRIASFAGNVQGFEVLDKWVKGPMVFNERVDRFSTGPLKQWHGVGVFFLKDGKIVEWQDFTIELQRR